MKKKVLAVVITLLTFVALFSGCGNKVVCDYCGEEKKCETKRLLDEEINICDDCMDELEEFYEG